jgi:RHS repeat-associated protein
MYDSHGTQTWSCELSSCGEVRNITGTRGDCPFRYQGQYEDVETGLYYNRFRYYDPNIGNYLSQDPIGLAGGNPTLYGYVGDVNTWVDVFGLTKYIVYQAPELDSNGNLTGKIYTGRTSGSDNMTTKQILDKRKSTHHRNLGQLNKVYETDDYKAVRGAEDHYIKEQRKKGNAADQIDGIAERNFGKKGKKKKGDLYKEAFEKDQKGKNCGK